jgi:hypothetical protein
MVWRYGILVSKERNKEDKKEFVLIKQSVLERSHAVERSIRRPRAQRGHRGSVSSHVSSWSSLELQTVSINSWMMKVIREDLVLQEMYLPNVKVGET